jgi:hypothetical protein
MKNIILLAIFLFSTYNGLAQITNVQVKFALPTILSEASGAIFFNDKLIIHNDSGNENKLYALDTISGLVTRTVTVTNATNVDWEDITQDETSIYIADIGNNSGIRTDLKIYKILKSDYTSATNVTAETINFSYADQTAFISSPNNTKWDAEALISFDATTLILCTKNWVDGITKAYPIPKNSGTYAVNPLPTTLNAGGMITGASYNTLTQKVYLIGYTSLLQPFVWVSENFTNNDIFSGSSVQTALTSLGFEQAESITAIGANRYFVTSESFTFAPFSDTAKLVSFTTNDNVLSLTTQPKNIVSAYPNPVNNILTIEAQDFTSFEIYDTKTNLLYKGNNKEINVSTLQKGLYLIKINQRDQNYSIKKILKE